MKTYSYYFVSQLGNVTHTISFNRYEDVYDFMKNEVKEEFDRLVNEFSPDDKLPYEVYHMVECNIDPAGENPRYQEMIEVAEEYYQLVKSGEENRETLDEVKERLDKVEEEFIEYPAYVALLRCTRGKIEED